MSNSKTCLGAKYCLYKVIIFFFFFFYLPLNISLFIFNLIKKKNLESIKLKYKNTFRENISFEFILLPN